ncbi:MYB transcription factor [Parasponia andersonii]|uniref:MYB transcription factor n=1 Tax=Parasponia andersonii TaxID=3476 RepID=A0A2P5CDD6_PARAD|nr:MYB transcription factor [Parasponia andersonii]
MVLQEEIRKGPWTEQEDFKLVCFVGLFGDRRWDFIAKVSGLNRTGKSCRLRWVNYLHPGLKRGKMTPQEERLVLELHSKWGNRWSRIARKLPGRTDNEIKNYWRTHMRKKAQEKKRSSSSSPSPPSSSSAAVSSPSQSSSSSNITTVEVLPFQDSTTGVESFYDTGGLVVSGDHNEVKGEAEEKKHEDHEQGCYSMDDIWKEISLPEVNDIGQFCGQQGGYNCADLVSCPLIEAAAPPSPAVWDQYYCSDSLWKNNILDEVTETFFSSPTATTAIIDNQFNSAARFEYGGASLTG